MLGPLSPRALAPLLEDLGLDRAPLYGPKDLPAEGTRVLLAAATGTPEELARELPALAPRVSGAEDSALFFLDGPREDAELARWRDACWPALHLTALYRL